MADLMDRLGRRQEPREVSEMLQGLEDAKGKKTRHFQTKKSTFSVDNSNISVDSWRLQDWAYKQSNLPTYARGLFTTKNAAGQAEIAVRGYDKFFNHGEVRETEWENVKRDTRGPYELSVKENGCIIFMAGLEDGTLIVCSKHSTGSRGDIEVSHAEWGQKWVDRHVQSVGRTREELAKTLRAMNATAVAELCDDEFEEHVLEYAPNTAGLYLHGINLNLPEFVTYPHALVDSFADQWGFKRTQYIVEQDIDNVHKFLDNIAETGNYDGRDTEGFVIRCQSKANTGQWHDWFFKYKFEEPYLMYRQWRECTKAIIGGREPVYKKHKQITAEYLDFARRQLHGNKELGQAYNQNHGIIKMRDDFLASRGLTGADIIRNEQHSEQDTDGPHDIILVPVATIGCGKTTVALTLAKLFGWGHVQNDNITVKSRKPEAFAHACVNALGEAPVMIADRNNHQRRERKQIIEDVTKVLPWAKFVALHYRHDRENFDRIREATRRRVLTRGDNHQTIHAGTKGPTEIIGIMEGFMGRFEPVDADLKPDDGFDMVIDLDPLASTQHTVDLIIRRLYEEYPKLFKDARPPSQDEIEAAIASATSEYRIEVKHSIKSSSDKSSRNPAATAQQTNGNAKKKEKKVEYFGVSVPVTRVNAVLEAVFRNSDPEVAKMYTQLKREKRLQQEFHVTLIHRASAQQQPDLWQSLQARYDEASAATESRAYAVPEAKLGLCNVQLERLVWNDRVMAFVARLVPQEGSQDTWRTANETPHVTVGTANSTIKPVESNDMLAQWLRTGSAVNGIQELAIAGNVTLEGVVKAVLAR
ncbi:hypothetical protein AMS68_007451 [Peltaster fructicola]|uniref:tRNA ligase n=1 Tax=Peltaster fructicola TaxID=286661 RepID=A0A6H0Y4J5_9PEZI|nr:hypothetical protein AMS68_007451 [Peltaster fructicola]